MTWYLDTSAAVKALVEEEDSNALIERLSGLRAEGAIVSSMLLVVELGRAAQRRFVDQEAADRLLSAIELASMTDGVYRRAGALPGEHLRSLDALHLAAALHLDVDGMLTYDQRLAQACREAGLRVSSPSAD